MATDTGYFGPESASWHVQREVTVLFGGARALLQQAAHPLVVAGANQTGMYDRNPWKRLQRTLILTYTVTFGTTAEADAAAARINEVHTRINGIDPVTGKPYDALDPHLLLYVHACLVDSALLFEELTVGALDDDGRERYHREQMLAAEMMLVPRDAIPPTVPALRAWLADVADRGELQVTEGARRVFELFQHPPRRGGVASRPPADLAARGRDAAAGRARDVRRARCRGRARPRCGRPWRRSAPRGRSCRGGSATWRPTTSGGCASGGSRSSRRSSARAAPPGSGWVRPPPRLAAWTSTGCSSTSTACS